MDHPVYEYQNNSILSPHAMHPLQVTLVGLVFLFGQGVVSSLNTTYYAVTTSQGYI